MIIMMQTTSLIFIYVTSVLCLPGLESTPNSRFCAITNCSCPQEVTAYECRVCGRATVWEGTALDSCSGGEITLTSQDFMEPLQPIYCNGGTVAVHGISAENGCFTSQLDIVFDTGFQGRTVRCLVDNGTHASEIGSDVLTLSIDPYPPPEGIRLAKATTSGLVFKWNQTQNTCPSLSYNIIVSENCGQCPNSTNGTFVNCSNFSISSLVTLCDFAVQSVICGNSGAPVIGNLTSSIIVNITVPTINQVKTIPRYHIKHGLMGLTVTFPKVDPFIIYDGINGTATSYMIYYSDSDTGKLCGSSKLSPSLCDIGICSEEFYDIVELSMCRASANINVTVSVITTLGEGPQSNPIKEEHQNNFVDVQLIHSRSESISINCTFLTMAKGTPISCIATTDSVTDTKPCPYQRSMSGTRENDNDLSIIIRLDNFLEETDSSKYCGIKINATADARTVIVNGNFLAISNPNQTSGSATAAVVLLPMAIIVTIIIKFV